MEGVCVEMGNFLKLDTYSADPKASYNNVLLSDLTTLPKTNALKPLAFSYGDTRRNAFRRANME